MHNTPSISFTSGHFSSFSNEGVAPKKDARYITVMMTLVLLAASCVIILLLFREVSLQRRLQSLIPLDRRHLREILDNSASSVCVKDLRLRYLLVNRPFEEQFEIAREAVLGKTDYDLFPKRIADPLHEKEMALLKTGNALEWVEKTPRKDGIRYFLNCRFPLKDEKGGICAICGIATDITEQKLAQEGLLRGILTSLEDVVWSTSANGREFLYFSPAAEKVYGRPIHDFYENPMLWLEMVAPEDKEKVQRAYEAMQSTGTFNMEYRIRRMDGEIRWLYDRGAVVKDKEGRPIRRDGVVTDITANKKLEEMKEDFYNIITHELRAPLAVIRGMLENMRDGLEGPLTPPQKDFIEMGCRQADRLSHIVNELLDLARLESGGIQLVPRPLNVTELVRKTLQDMAQMARQRQITIREEFAETLPLIEGDEERLAQVLTNLLDNAIRFGKKEIVVRASPAEQQTVRISIIDDGPGIEPACQSCLFNKYVQVGVPTAEKNSGYKGTGLGLVICKQLVNLHHGKIWVESHVGHGSTFSFTLPGHPA